MRLIPKLYWGASIQSDAAGNKCISYFDYRKQKVDIWEPSCMPIEIAYPFEVPHILAPFDLFDMPNSSIAFFVSPKTVYSDFWENYPRRITLSGEFIKTNSECSSYIHDGVE